MTQAMRYQYTRDGLIFAIDLSFEEASALLAAKGGFISPDLSVPKRKPSSRVFVSRLPLTNQPAPVALRSAGAMQGASSSHPSETHQASGQPVPHLTPSQERVLSMAVAFGIATDDAARSLESWRQHRIASRRRYLVRKAVGFHA